LPEVEIETAAAEIADVGLAVDGDDLKVDLPEVEIESPKVDVNMPVVGIAAAGIAAIGLAAAGDDVEVDQSAVEIETSEVEIEAAKALSQPAAPDNLKSITGIGPTYARILQAHGIQTFAGLAGMEEGALAAMIDAPTWRSVDYAGWISQAREKVDATGDSNTPPIQPVEAVVNRPLSEDETGKPPTQRSRSVSCPQDLSRVLGIGQIFEERLYDAGIGTFWDLGNMVEDELREILEIGGYEDIDLQAICGDALRLASATGTENTVWDGTPHDDLESLRGIGTAEQEQLYAAGMCTYGALVAAGVTGLVKACPAASGQSHNYTSWISQSQDRLRTE
jgi:predicted flap endonuclease-1-like 5' DNA nuclease